MTITERLVNKWASKASQGTIPALFEHMFREPVQADVASMPRFGVPWVLVSSPIGHEKMTYHMTRITIVALPRAFVPRTELGRALSRLRKQAIDSGMELWDADTVLAEVKRNRGELNYEEEDVR